MTHEPSQQTGWGPDAAWIMLIVVRCGFAARSSTSAPADPDFADESAAHCTQAGSTDAAAICAVTSRGDVAVETSECTGHMCSTTELPPCHPVLAVFVSMPPANASRVG